MKYCSNCGKEMRNSETICPGCGCEVGHQRVKYIYRERSSSNDKLKTAAKVFMVLSTVIGGITCYLVPLLWCIPMTIAYFKKVENDEEISISFKICCLIFVSLVAGIFMLCDND